MRSFAALIVFIFSAALQSQAGEFKFKKKVNLSKLQKELVSNGFKVDYIQCSDDRCSIHLPKSEKKDPRPWVEKHAYVDHILAAKKERERNIALILKWKEGRISDQEKDSLLQALAAQILGVRD